MQASKKENDENSIDIPSSPFDLFPTELYFYLVKFLTNNEIFALMLTSRTFYTLMLDDAVWKPRYSHLNAINSPKTQASLFDNTRKRKRQPENKQQDQPSAVKRRRTTKKTLQNTQEIKQNLSVPVKGHVYQRLEQDYLIFNENLTRHLNVRRKFLQNADKNYQSYEQNAQIDAIKELAPLVRWGKIEELSNFIKNYNGSLPLHELITLRINHNRPTLLGIAVEAGNLDVVKLILSIYSKKKNSETKKSSFYDSLSDIFNSRKFQKSPLHLAVINDRTEILEYFVENEVYHPIISSSFQSDQLNILFDLVKYNPKVQLLNYLLQHWVVFPKQNESSTGYTSSTFPDKDILDMILAESANMGRLELFNILFFEWGANIHVLYKNYTILKYAIDSKQGKIVELCAENNVRTIDRMTNPLEYVFTQGRAIKKFFEPYSSQFDDLETRIKNNIRIGNAERAINLLDKKQDCQMAAKIFDYLIEHYASRYYTEESNSFALEPIFHLLVSKYSALNLVNRLDENKKTPLDRVIIYGLKNNFLPIFKLIRLLLQYNANSTINFPTLYNMLVPYIIRRPFFGVLDEKFAILTFLVRYNVLNIKDANGNTILHLALKSLNADTEKIARFLITNELVDVVASNNDGHSCLTLAHSGISSSDKDERERFKALYTLMYPIYLLKLNQRSIVVKTSELPMSNLSLGSLRSPSYTVNTSEPNIAPSSAIMNRSESRLLDTGDHANYISTSYPSSFFQTQQQTPILPFQSGPQDENFEAVEKTDSNTTMEF